MAGSPVDAVSHHQLASHEVVAGAAHARALEGRSGPASGARNGTDISPLPRFGITTLTLVPAMRNPCAVSSLFMRSSIVLARLDDDLATA